MTKEQTLVRIDNFEEIAKKVENEKEIKKILDFVLINIDEIVRLETEGIKEIKNKIDKPLEELMSKQQSQETNDIGSMIMDLKLKVNSLSPESVINPSFMDKLFSFFNQNRIMNKFITKFKKTKPIIEDIMHQLEKNINILQQQNKEFNNYKTKLKDLINKLNKKIEALNLLYEKAKNVKYESEEEKNKTLAKLLRKIENLTEIKSVALIGNNAIDVLIENNELNIETTKEVISVMIPALDISTVVAIGLDTQKKVIETNKAVKETTSDLILKTSEMLKNQGVETQKMASEPLLAAEKLHQAIQNVNEALTDLENHKKELLPKLQKKVSELNTELKKIEIKNDKITSG